ncbi:hypothetical protein HKX48_000665 [Thoreauomyces humboldtii]|nr:hypothetical protein HKX48_000665 [Thoreauomyces humboldtii]
MASRLALYARRPPRPVRFSEMLKFGSTPSPAVLLSSSRFLADEISVRLAHRYAELESLPYGLSTSPEAVTVRNWYQTSFNDLNTYFDEIDAHLRDPERAPKWSRGWWSQKFANVLSPSDPKVSAMAVPAGVSITGALMEAPQAHSSVSQSFHQQRYFNDREPVLPPHMLNSIPHYTKRFNTLLHDIVQRHNPVVLTVSQAIQRLLPPHMPQHHPEVQAFLNRFHSNRVGVRILIGHHLALSNPQSRRFPHHIGIVSTEADAATIAGEAADDAIEICEQAFGDAPKVNIVVDRSVHPEAPVSFVYVPSHMHHILFELLKNAMRATLMKHQASSNPFPATPVSVTITPTPTHVVIKVSDSGTGIPASQLPNVMTYAYTTARPIFGEAGAPIKDPSEPPFLGSELEAPMAGFGYGLPLARLYARFFKGDLTLKSVEGKGTDVIFTVKRDWADDGAINM